MFYGVFLACLKIKNYTLDPLQQKIFDAQINNPQLIDNIADLISNDYLLVIEEAAAIMEEEENP